MALNRDWEHKISPVLRECVCNRPGECGQIFIELSGKDKSQITSMIVQKKGRIKQDIALMPGIVVEIAFAALPELAQSRQVKKIWIDSEVKIL